MQQAYTTAIRVQHPIEVHNCLPHRVLVNLPGFQVLSLNCTEQVKEVETSLMSGLLDMILSLYPKLIPWKFRDRFGSPLITRLMASKGNSVQFKDYKVFLNPRDKTATELFLIHVNSDDWIWESYELGLFGEAISANENPVVIDMGANYGHTRFPPVISPRTVASKNVIAIEPNRETFSCLNDPLMPAASESLRN